MQGVVPVVLQVHWEVGRAFQIDVRGKRCCGETFQKQALKRRNLPLHTLPNKKTPPPLSKIRLKRATLKQIDVEDFIGEICQCQTRMTTDY